MDEFIPVKREVSLTVILPLRFNGKLQQKDVLLVIKIKTNVTAMQGSTETILIGE